MRSTEVEGSFKNKAIQQYSEIKSIRKQGGNERVTFAYDNLKYQLVEDGLKAEIDKLNERKVTTFGFSARRTGKATKDQKTFVEDDTLGILKKLNINFQSNYHTTRQFVILGLEGLDLLCKSSHFLIRG